MLLILFAFSSATVTTPMDPLSVPPRFRLEPASFAVVLTPKHTLAHCGVEVLELAYPSAVTTLHAENNTVVGELFRPLYATGKRPAVLVLDIMDGAQVVSRGQAVWLASHGITALTIRMPYYGARKPPGSKLKMVTVDIEHSVAAVTQAVLDARRGIAYLASRPDVDADRLGVLGTSLGSFVAGLVLAAEPKLSRGALFLGGGDLVNSFYDHPKAKAFTQINELIGGSQAKLKVLIDPIDPVTYAEQLKAKKLLLMAASRDDVVPPKAMTALWEATGRPPLVWFDGTHVGGALYAFPAMEHAIRLFQK